MSNLRSRLSEMVPGLTLALGLYLLAVTPAVFAAPVPKVKDPAEKLHGKWELTKSAGEEVTDKHLVIFDKDGTLTLEIERITGKATYKGKYTFANMEIDYELNMDGIAKKEVLKVKKLDDSEMVTTDPDKVEEIFKKKK